MLRAVQIGVDLRDLELITIGMLTDMYIEALNDSAESEEGGTRMACQADFDTF